MQADEMEGQLLAWPTPKRAHRGARPGSVAAVDVAGYLEDIAARQISGFAMAGRVRLGVDRTSRLALPPDRLEPLGQIVRELVANSLKYAHPAGVTGRIEIGFSRRQGANVIGISDDGVGLPEGLDPLASELAGFVRIRTLAARLGASVSFGSAGLGLICSVRLPYAEVAVTAAKAS